MTPNVDILRQAVTDPRVGRVVRKADLRIADGMPLVWASRLQGTPLRERLAFSEMVYPLARAAAAKGLTFFLLGGEPGTAELAAETLIGRVPELKVVGTYAPPLGFECVDSEIGQLVEALRSANAAIVICGFGCPKQEKLMFGLAPLFPSTWFIGAGGTLTLLAGRTSPAPGWMRRSGLEWLHRLRLEPRRLFRRYVVDDIPFAIRLLWSSALSRSSSRPVECDEQPLSGAGSCSSDALTACEWTQESA